MEDCQQAKFLTYNYDELQGLEFIALDFSQTCYDSTKVTLKELQKTKYNDIQIYVHFNQYDGIACGDIKKCLNTPLSCPPIEKKVDPCCAGDVKKYPDRTTQCVNTLNTQWGDELVKRINGVLWESESNRIMNQCASPGFDCAQYFTAAFGKPIKFAGWSNKFDFIGPMSNDEWDYVFYQFYNIYAGNPPCNKNSKDNTNCVIDYGCFIGAQPGPVPPLSPVTKPPNCGKDNRNTIYDDSSSVTLTPAQRGKWLAHILIVKYKEKIPPIPKPNKVVIFFPFTNSSFPTWVNTLKTAAEFDAMVESFMTECNSNGCTNISQCKIGAWGCPQWLGVTHKSGNKQDVT